MPSLIRHRSITNTGEYIETVGFSLSYYRPTTSLLYRINKPRMEEIGIIIPKYKVIFFFLSFFIFIAHFFRGWKFFSNSLFVHSIVYLITHSFLQIVMDFSHICISTSPMYALPVILFSA